ncbi:MAG: hypothetical protein CM1200mP26_25750 [Acidimicrobiales bacterium]|nr:MAG: hypothetical protein CM1200mP26_25750 [Acidimicrobiales bacterium]
MTIPLGISLMPHGPVADLVGLARIAENLGCCRCWVYDEGLATRDVYVAMTAVALATSTIRVGTGITNPYSRHPGTTASAIATIDELSGQRAFVGIGAGGGMTLGPMGIERRRPVAAVEAMVGALRGLYAGEEVDVESEGFRFSVSPSRLRARRHGDISGRPGSSHDRLGRPAGRWLCPDLGCTGPVGRHVAALRVAAKIHGRRFTIVWSTMLVTTDADLWMARESLSFRLPDSPVAVKEMIGMTRTTQGLSVMLSVRVDHLPPPISSVRRGSRTSCLWVHRRR